jgi:hypothetical protein
MSKSKTFLTTTMTKSIYDQPLIIPFQWVAQQTKASHEAIVQNAAKSQKWAFVHLDAAEQAFLRACDVNRLLYFVVYRELIQIWLFTQSIL